MDITVINHSPQLQEWDCDELDYFPYDISNITYFNPIYANFMTSSNPCDLSLGITTTDASCKNIQFSHQYHIYTNTSIIDNSGSIIQKDIFFKYAPLLDPCHYMIGKYKYDKHITKIVKHYYHSEDNKKNDNNENNYHEKLQTIHNASYVDNFTCALINMLNEKYHFKHGVNYYGSITGIQKQFRMNIADDIDFLQEQEFFQEHIGSLFHTNIFSKGLLHNEATNTTLKYKKALSISDDISLNDFDEIIVPSANNINDTNDTSDINTNIKSFCEPEVLELTTDNLKEHTFIENDNNDTNDSDNSSMSDTNDSDNSEENNTEDSNSISEIEVDENSNASSNEISDYDSSVEEEPLYAYINNFPVIMIALSKCKDTFDSLLNSDEHMDTEFYIAALFQIIMILLTLQKAFHFTHNDLHTNNIMYEETTITHIHYIYKGIHYTVPTYGKIFKLIDFGRSIVTYNGTTYCSDSFKKDGDANTQYNFGPFYDSTKKRIEPNYSFDLCRLGCSIYDFIIDDEASIHSFDDFQRIIYQWCCDDNGKNVLYKKNGDERYPNFKLYKMIARIVHNHTPEKQLQRSAFKKFISSEPINDDDIVVNIDTIPSFA